MASKTLTLNFLDANEPGIVAALKDAAKTEEIPAPTKAQAWNWFEACCKASLRDVVKRYRREAAIKAAEASVTDVDVT